MEEHWPKTFAKVLFSALFISLFLFAIYFLTVVVGLEKIREKSIREKTGHTAKQVDRV